MTDFKKFLLKAFARKGLTILGTYLLAKGIISEAEAGNFVTQYLDEIVGSLLLGVAYGWEFLYQRLVRLKVSTALKLPRDSTPKQLDKAIEAKQGD